MEKNKRRAMLSWLFVAALFVLCAVLGVLQYRWIGEVSEAERERLRGSLRASLVRLGDDFNSEVTAAARSLLPDLAPGGAIEEAFLAHYRQWRQAAGRARWFERVALAVERDGALVLLTVDHERGVLKESEWPETWHRTRERMESRFAPPGSRPRPPRPFSFDTGPVLELPLIAMPPPGAPPAPFDRRNAGWVIAELDLEHARDAVLPRLVRRHLGPDYQVEVLTRGSSPAAVYQSDPAGPPLARAADASVALFELQYDRLFRRRTSRSSGIGRGPGPEMGRWRMFARHRAGSLEAVVAAARRRNLAVIAGVLLLMAASSGALFRSTRRAQKLAEMQMDFVAGVSHELRTPLTVIHTAAYNLRGRVSGNPAQVERYGALIQRESARLKELVEQVLQFASAKAGRVIRDPEPLSIESVVEDSLESSKAIIQSAGCVVEKRIEPALPPVMGDSVSLRQALDNLIGNAAKYGTEGCNWIGVFAAMAKDEPAAVEIRVADRGAGIPEDEQERIFDPFFRGRRALEDQVHGTGLGLYMVKSIIEAHGGSIRVRSAPMKGAEFIVRIPVIPEEQLSA